MKRNICGSRRSRRTFSDELKREAVWLARERGAGEPLAQIGRELDVTVDQLRDWARQRDPETMSGPAVGAETLEEENCQLKWELETLRKE